MTQYNGSKRVAPTPRGLTPTMRRHLRELADIGLDAMQEREMVEVVTRKANLEKLLAEGCPA